MRGCSEPIVRSVDESDGNAREFLFRGTLQTADVDAVHLADGRFRSDTEGTDAAVPAEVVQVLPRVELVLRKLGFAGQQAKAFLRGHCGPEPGSAAYRAVAAIRILGKVEFGLEPDCSAMATTAVRFEHGVEIE